MAVDKSLILSLSIHFLINLTLSVSNKHTLNHFPYPWTITALHAATTYVGSVLLTSRTQDSSAAQPQRTQPSRATLILFSSLFTINIAVSNISLNKASLAFHQVVRSTGPLVVVFIQRFWHKTRYSNDIHMAVFAMCVGISLTTAGDFYITPLGLILTLLGTVLASIKTLATNALMTGEQQISPNELLRRTSPLAAVQAFMLGFSAGELNSLMSIDCNEYVLAVLATNIFLAFMQNTFSFKSNKAAGPLTMTVVGNLKQIATIVVGMVTFKTKTGCIGGVGMMMAVAGSGYYSFAKIGGTKIDNKRPLGNTMVDQDRNTKIAYLNEKPRNDSPV